MATDPVLIQPVETPVICKPYCEPAQYWEYDRNTGRAQKMEGRRAASYWYKDPLNGYPARADDVGT